MPEPDLTFIAQQLASLLTEQRGFREEFHSVLGCLGAIELRLGTIETRVNGIPLIGEAITKLQHDSRLLRAAVNDIAKINITAGEVEAMHADIDMALAQIRDLTARVKTLEDH
jgi:hypothetical protein